MKRINQIVLISFLLLVGCEKSGDKPYSFEMKPENNQIDGTIITGNEETDKKYGLLSLQAARAYLSGNSTTAEARNQAVATIRSHRDYMLEDGGFAFSLLAGYIEKGSKENAERAYLELVKKYVPESESKQYAIASPSGNEVKPKPASNAAPAQNMVAQMDPVKVKSEIAKNAAKMWKDDHVMQVFEIKEQTAAYNELIELVIDSEEKRNILEQAIRRWDFDFIMIQFTYGEQLRAFQTIKRMDLSNPTYNTIMEKALKRWGDDYEMVLFEFEEQLEAYNELQKLK
ncbi:MAG: hypothetical protein K0Q73_3768 [Paenibacillus sp.]|nr:hypothetical protein [Paenibacillus sp.]